MPAGPNVSHPEGLGDRFPNIIRVPEARQSTANVVPRLRPSPIWASVRCPRGDHQSYARTGRDIKNEVP